MKSTNNHHAVRRIIVALHRDLGFFFAGVVLIYALSGILMNHRDKINPNYSVQIIEMQLPKAFPYTQAQVTDADVKVLAAEVGESDNVIKHFFTKGDLKLLFKGGSSMVADLRQRTATYEKVSRRPIVSDMVRLHYNPGSWWSVFSDIFAVGLVIVTLTGLFIVKGRHGILGRGGILLILGLLIPVLFLLI